MAADITYKSISLSLVLGSQSGGSFEQTVAIAINDDSKAYRCSLSSSSNKLHVEFATVSSLSEWRATAISASAVASSDVPGPYEGACMYSETNIATNSTKSIDIPLKASYFTAGDGKYRIGLYAQDAADGIWDMTQIYMVWNPSSSSYEDFETSDSSSGFSVAVKDGTIAKAS